jgi:2-polyprenyl-3-methyl-5-hydroxy-6-metoxy-1,4-benzoquinol methylase
MKNKKKHIYEYNVDLDGNSAPAKIIRMIGSRKKVLEIGIGPGSIARYLFSEGHCKVTGIEIDARAIEIARPFCESIYKADLNKSDWVNLVEDQGPFDVVLAADVLEHLYEPWVVLAQMKALVRKGGSLIVSLPHIGHAAVVACLMAEDFEYQDWGLLDRTHIRFFAIKNIQKLIKQVGLKIIQADYCTRKPEDTEFAAHWEKLPDPVKYGLLENPHSTVYQVILRTVPEDAEGDPIKLMDQIVGNFAPSTPCEIMETKGDSVGGKVQLIAFYLPQFHPIPENDLWWGKGFTEWTNVAKSIPLFEGHYQPHLPADFGFYDLRLRQNRHNQEEMAKHYGIDGFCYHYYWFSGKRLLERPLDDMLNDSDSSMPFCLCWANENWTRRWDAAEHEILIAQEYREENDVEFIKSLIPYFNDSRYVKKDGAPFFIVYRPQHLPDAQKSISIWRDFCRNNGFSKIHICCALTHGNENYQQYGFDSGVEFPPHNTRQLNVNDQITCYESFEGNFLVYDRIANSFLDRKYNGGNVFKTVFPSWDNTPRVSSRALVVLNGTPANFEFWLAETIRRTKKQFSRTDRFVFINAWNEWAEGCHLEPDQRYGHQFLEATLRAKTGTSCKSGFEDRMLPNWPNCQCNYKRLQKEGVTEFLRKSQEEIAKIRGEFQIESSSLQEKVQTAKNEIAHLKTLINEYSSSRSWKITKPLRDLRGVVKNATSRKKRGR